MGLYVTYTIKGDIYEFSSNAYHVLMGLSNGKYDKVFEKAKGMMDEAKKRRISIHLDGKGNFVYVV